MMLIEIHGNKLKFIEVYEKQIDFRAAFLSLNRNRYYKIWMR